MVAIRFELRTDKVDKNGMAPVRVIYQISGQRKLDSIRGLKQWKMNNTSITQRTVEVKSFMKYTMKIDDVSYFSGRNTP